MICNPVRDGTHHVAACKRRVPLSLSLWAMKHGGRVCGAVIFGREFWSLPWSEYSVRFVVSVGEHSGELGVIRWRQRLLFTGDLWGELGVGECVV